MEKTVKKQHYIWRKYLSQWTDSGDRFAGKLFVFRKSTKGKQNKIEFRELEKIGYENYYYDISGYKEKDVEIVNKIISNIQRNEFVKFGVSDYFLYDAASQRDYIEKNVMRNFENLDNDYHFLEKLLHGDISFYRDSIDQCIYNELKQMILHSKLYEETISEDQLFNLIKNLSVEQNVDLKYEFNRFFCMQYFRSPRVHTKTKDRINRLRKKYEAINDLNINYFTNMVTIYFAERMAVNFSQIYQSNILLYQNSTDIPFVTGDSPIVCLGGENLDDLCMFHYPISPQIAVELFAKPVLFDNTFTNKNMIYRIKQDSVSIVNELNREIFENCANEIYSNSENILTKFGCDF